MDSPSIKHVLEAFKDDIIEIERLTTDVQRSIARAMPAVEVAFDALKKLDRQAIAEVRAFVLPPDPVMQTIMAVMTVMKKAPLSWAQAKMELGDGFLQKVIYFDKDSISAETLVEIEAFTNDPSFVPAAVSKVSIAAGALCQWVHAMKIYARGYGEVATEVEPQKLKLKLALDDFERKTGVSYELIVESRAKAEAEVSAASVASAVSREWSIWNAWMSVLALDAPAFPESPEHAFLTEIVSLQEHLPFVASDVWDGAAEAHLSRFLELVSLVGDFLLVPPCLQGDAPQSPAETTLAGSGAASSVVVTSASGEVVLGPEPLPAPVTVAEPSRRAAARRSCRAVQCRLLLEGRELRADELLGGGGGATGPLQLSLVIVSCPPLPLDFDVLREAVAVRTVNPTAPGFLRDVDLLITKLACTIERQLNSNFEDGLMEGLSEIAADISAFFKLWEAFAQARRALA